MDSDFTEPFTLTEMPARNIVLYAKWEEDDDHFATVVVPIIGACIGGVATLTAALVTTCKCKGWCCFEKKGCHQTQKGVKMTAVRQRNR